MKKLHKLGFIFKFTRGVALYKLEFSQVYTVPCVIRTPYCPLAGDVIIHGLYIDRYLSKSRLPPARHPVAKIFIDFEYQ